MSSVAAKAAVMSRAQLTVSSSEASAAMIIELKRNPTTACSRTAVRATLGDALTPAEWAEVEVLAGTVLTGRRQPSTHRLTRAVGWDDEDTRWADLVDVAVTDARISITLSGPGGTAFPEDTERVSVQQLVWTAQAAVGRGTIPVRFVLADGAAETWACAVFMTTSLLLFGISATYHRFPWSPRAKMFLKRLDHSNIFLIIAGTYTPLAVALPMCFSPSMRALSGR